MIHRSLVRGLHRGLALPMQRGEHFPWLAGNRGPIAYRLSADRVYNGKYLPNVTLDLRDVW